MLSQTGIARAWGPRCYRGPTARIALNGSGHITVRAGIVEAVLALNECLKAHGYRTRASDTGALVCREKVGGGGMSNHSFGTALDVNWNCLAGDTRILTWDGPIEIGKLAGTTQRLLTRDPIAGGAAYWVDAPIRSFGEAETFAVLISRRGKKRTVRSTANHRWFTVSSHEQARKTLS